MRKAILIIMGIFLLFAISGCLQDDVPVPKPYEPEVEVNVTPTNQTNETIEEQKQVIAPSEDLAIYILETQDLGSYVITQDNKSMLINAQGGLDTLTTIKTISNIGITRLDYFVLTNSYDQNIAGAPAILLREKPFNLIHSGIPSPSLVYKQYTEFFPNATILPSDRAILLGDALVSFLVPYDDGQPLSGDDSFLVKVDYGNFNVLFATDCEIDCESRVKDKQIASKIIVSNGRCDSLSLSFLLEVFPEVVVFSGDNVCKETYDRVYNLGITILETQQKGDIMIHSNGDTYNYEAER